MDFQKGDFGKNRFQICLGFHGKIQSIWNLFLPKSALRPMVTSHCWVQRKLATTTRVHPLLISAKIDFRCQEGACDGSAKNRLPDNCCFWLKMTTPTPKVLRIWILFFAEISRGLFDDYFGKNGFQMAGGVTGWGCASLTWRLGSPFIHWGARLSAVYRPAGENRNAWKEQNKTEGSNSSRFKSERVNFSRVVRVFSPTQKSYPDFLQKFPPDSGAEKNTLSFWKGKVLWNFSRHGISSGICRGKTWGKKSRPVSTDFFPF